MVATEFPALLPMLAVQQGDKKVDLLPRGNGEELRAMLSAFQSQLQALGGKPPVNPPATPPSPAPAAQNSSSSILRQAMEAMNKGETAEYNRLYTEYIESQK